METNNSKHTTGQRLIQTGFFLAVIGISAVSTYAFFANFVEALIPPDWVGDPLVRHLLTGMIGVILLDGAALTWQYILHFHGEQTVKQLQIASIMSGLSLLLAVLISMSWFILSTAFVDDQAIIEAAGMMGLIIIIAATGAQFAAVWWYKQNSVESENRRLQAEAAATVRDAYQARLRANLRQRTSALVDDAIGHNQPLTEDDILRNLKAGGIGRLNGQPAAPTPSAGASFARDLDETLPVPKARSRR